MNSNMLAADTEEVNSETRTVENNFQRLFTFNVFYTLLLLLCSAGALFFFAQVYRFLPVTGDNVYPEAAGVLSAYRWAHGLPLYEDFRHAPYLVTAFPPGWYAIMAAGTKLGFDGMNALTLFGRLLSLASLLLIVTLGYRWNRRVGLPLGLALLTPALYLAFPILIPWAVSARPDLVELLFAFLALYIASFHDDAVWLALAAVSCAAAFLIRHNAVAAPATLAVWFVWSRQWKKLWTLSALWLFVVCGTIIVSNGLSHGLLLLNLSGAKFGHLALTYVRDVLLRMFGGAQSGFVVILFVVGLLGLVSPHLKAGRQSFVLRTYLLISFGLAIIGSSAAGAAMNHYMQPALAMAVLAPGAIAQLQKNWERSQPFPVFAVIVTLVLLLPALDAARWEAMHNRPDDMKPLLAVVNKGTVFTDIPYLAARSARPQLLDLASLVYAAKVGRWNGGGQVAQDLGEQKYDYLILSSLAGNIGPKDAYYPRYPHITREMQSMIEEKYSVCFQVGTAYVYGRVSNGLTDAGKVCPGS